jgi:hypothetical protein
MHIPQLIDPQFLAVGRAKCPLSLNGGREVRKDHGAFSEMNFVLNSIK